MLSLFKRHPFALWFGLGLLAISLPLLTTPFTPFHDSFGIVGLAGALVHRGDPAARIGEFFDFDLGLYPSVLYLGWGFLAGLLHVSLAWAYAVFLLLFGILGPPLAVALLLRAFRRPPWLALLVFPVSYHQQIWFGFLGSSAAITGLVATLAFAKRAADEPRVAHFAGLAGALLFVAMAHPFPFAFSLAVAAPLLVWPVGERRRWVIAARVAAFLPALLFLGPWVTSFFGAPTGTMSLVTRLRSELRIHRPPLGEDVELFVKWLVDGYIANDEIVAWIALATLVAFLLVGVRAEPPARGPNDSWARLWLAWAALLFLGGYTLLPQKLYWPTYWWGVRVRCAVPLYLVALAVVRPRRRGLPVWALAPAYAVGLAFAAFIFYDFAFYWRGQRLVGFDRAIAALPPGQTVLYFPGQPEPRYTHGHPYLVQEYVARTGGMAWSAIRGHKGALWVAPHEPPAMPAWGDVATFDWEEHALGWDYFLVEQPPEGPTVDLRTKAPPGALELVVGEGTRWWLFRKTHAAL